MRALGAVGDAAGIDDVAEQAQIGKIESHRVTSAFAFDEARFNILPIVLALFQRYSFAKREVMRSYA